MNFLKKLSGLIIIAAIMFGAWHSDIQTDYNDVTFWMIEGFLAAIAIIYSYIVWGVKRY